MQRKQPIIGLTIAGLGFFAKCVSDRVHWFRDSRKSSDFVHGNRLRRTRASLPPIRLLSLGRFRLHHRRFCFELYRRSCLLGSNGDEHRHAAAVRSVLLAVKLQQITFFKLNGHEHVGRHADCKQKMRDRHSLRRPESRHPANVERVADKLVRSGRHESQMRVGLASEVEPDLT